MFGFTIRDVLCLTVVVGLCFGWWLERRETKRLYEQLVRNIHWADARRPGGVSNVNSSNP